MYCSICSLLLRCASCRPASCSAWPCTPRAAGQHLSGVQYCASCALGNSHIATLWVLQVSRCGRTLDICKVQQKHLKAAIPLSHLAFQLCDADLCLPLAQRELLRSHPWHGCPSSTLWQSQSAVHEEQPTAARTCPCPCKAAASRCQLLPCTAPRAACRCRWIHCSATGKAVV